MNFLCPGNACFGHSSHIYRFMAVLNNSIHDLYFLVLNQDASGHEVDYIRLIDNSCYANEMFKSRLH